MWVFLIILYLTSFSVSQDTIVSDEDPTHFTYYVTRPDIEAPKWVIQTYDAEALQRGSYYWFVAPYEKLDQDTYPMWNGPYIYRTDGELIWSGGSFFQYHNVHDFRASDVHGKKMLSLIRSHPGRALLFDETYTEYKSLDITSGYEDANMHDFNLIDDGKRALALLHKPVSVVHVPGSRNGTCKVKWEGFMEIDTDTNDILFEWNAQGHIALNETDKKSKKKTLEEACNDQRRAWDAQHVNSIDKFDNGDYLLSARNSDAIYKISHRDHSIVWRLGGSRSDFTMGPEARFERQHHARIMSENSTHVVISLFNNAQPRGFLTNEAITNITAGLILALRTDIEPMTAEVVTRFRKPDWNTGWDSSHRTRTRGSMQILPNGNAFLGWVDHCHISEHSADGRLLLQASFIPEKVNTYRSFKMEWVGKPAEPPDVVSKLVQKRKNGPLSTQVYMSWNGATEVVKWNVLGVKWLGLASKLLATKDSAGFETMVSLDGYIGRIAVAGLDINGKELGRSEYVKTADPTHIAPLNESATLSPVSSAIGGGLAAVIFVLAFLFFRKPLLECYTKVKGMAYRRGAGGEDDALLAAAAQEEEQREDVLYDKEMVEMEEYKDSRNSGDLAEQPG